MRLELGTQARCTDGAVRSLVDVVIEGSGRRVTHLVVQPSDDPDAARLVPIDLTSAADDGHEVSLHCTTGELDQLAPVRRHDYLRAGERTRNESGWDVGAQDVQAMPLYTPGPFGEYGADLTADVAVTYDRVPRGEIE